MWGRLGLHLLPSRSPAATRMSKVRRRGGGPCAAELRARTARRALRHGAGNWASPRFPHSDFSPPRSPASRRARRRQPSAAPAVEPKVPLPAKLVVGGIAGVIGTSVIFPLDMVKTRMQNASAPPPRARARTHACACASCERELPRDPRRRGRAPPWPPPLPPPAARAVAAAVAARAVAAAVAARAVAAAVAAPAPLATPVL